MRRTMASMVVSVMAMTAASAGPQDSAFDVAKRWAAAFTASDVDAIVALYAPGATFIGTGTKEVITDPAKIRLYFEGALPKGTLRTAVMRDVSTVALSETAAVVTGLDTVTALRDGQQSSADGRISFVVAKVGDDWRIVHFHRSAMPK